MATANTAARAFYDRVGFHEIEVPDPGRLTFLGREPFQMVGATV
jgi:ribosomal protein S18 acetylase RimI-like enzyme